MLRTLAGGCCDKLVTNLPSLQQKRTVINLTASLNSGKSAVAIAFGSNLVGNCNYLVSRCRTTGLLALLG